MQAVQPEDLPVASSLLAGHVDIGGSGDEPSIYPTHAATGYLPLSVAALFLHLAVCAIPHPIRGCLVALPPMFVQWELDATSPTFAAPDSP